MILLCLVGVMEWGFEHNA